MTILLLGKDGQVGWELQRSLAPLGELICLGKQPDSSYSGDLRNPDALRRTIRDIKPDVVVNAAAYTAVDKAESEIELANDVNAIAPRVLAEEVLSLNALLIHFSTDYVFDGSGTTPWSEGDAPSPLSVYGKTKLAGERAIQSTGCRHLIFRTSWVYAARGKNFLKTILRLAKDKSHLDVVDDQIGAPTGADLIADITTLIIYELMRNPGRALGPNCIFNLAAAGTISWNGFARFIVETAAEIGTQIALTPSNISPIGSDCFSTAATRPKNSRLDCSKLQETFLVTLPNWQTGVRRTLIEILEEAK